MERMAKTLTKTIQSRTDNLLEVREFVMHAARRFGFSEEESSKIVLAVVVDDPKGAYYGSAVAAPVFANILRRGWAYVK